MEGVLISCLVELSFLPSSLLCLSVQDLLEENSAKQSVRMILARNQDESQKESASLSIEAI